MIRAHYLEHFDALNALGHKKSAPHIKTNLFKFAPLYELFDRHRGVDQRQHRFALVLACAPPHHARRYRLAARTLDNIRLLARYPHAKKISATLSSEHLADIPALGARHLVPAPRAWVST